MKMRMGVALACAAAAVVAGAGQAPADVIVAQWQFNTVMAATFNSPAPDIGSGTATPLGMANGYTFSSGNTITGTGQFTYTTLYSVGSVAWADVLATPGDPHGFANAWRVRGPSNNPNQPPNMGNGWALQAPQLTQGAQFSTSTAGYTNITFHADWFTTAQGVKNVQPQYTTDGKTWINIGPLLTAVSNGWEQIDLNFGAIAGGRERPELRCAAGFRLRPDLEPPQLRECRRRAGRRLQ
jgi:hypothetical protein